MQPNRRTLVAVFCVIAVVPELWLERAQAQTPPFEASFGEISSASPVDGRIHVDIQTTVGDPRALRVVAERVEFVDGDVEIELRAEDIDADEQELLPPFEQTLPLTLDNLPAGEYALLLVAEDPSTGSVLNLDSLALSIPQSRRPRVPLPVSTWPPDPTVLDDVWLIVEPVSFCSVVDGGLIIGDAFIDDEPVAFETLGIFEREDDCPAPGQAPRLKTIPLEFVFAGGVTELSYIVEDSVRTSRFILPLRAELSRRMAGSWYNPGQSGQGITIEILDDGRLLLYWLTFAEGNPAWIIAVGDIDGLGAELDARRVFGGRFPPDVGAEEPESVDWGTIDISFSGCNSGHMEWRTEAPGFTDGEMPLTRLSAPAGQPCQGPPPESVLIPDWYQGAGTFFVLPGEDQ